MKFDESFICSTTHLGIISECLPSLMIRGKTRGHQPLGRQLPGCGLLAISVKSPFITFDSVNPQMQGTSLNIKRKCIILEPYERATVYLWYTLPGEKQLLQNSDTVSVLECKLVYTLWKFLPSLKNIQGYGSTAIDWTNFR